MINKQCICLLTIVYVFFITSGINIGISAILLMLAMFLFAIFTMESKGKFVNTVFKFGPVKALIIFLIMVSMALYISKYSSVKYILSLFSAFFPVILFKYFEESDKFKTVIKWTIFIWFVIGIRAVFLYSSGELSARELAAHVSTDTMLAGGGYGFAIGSAILATFWLELMLWGKKRKSFFNILFFIILALVVIETKSTITILAMFFGFITSVFLRNLNITSIRKMNTKQGVMCVLLLIGILFIMGFRSNIGELIIKYTQGSDDIVLRRFREFGILFTQGGDSVAYRGSDMAVRFELLKKSFDAFLENPIFGAVSKVGSNFYSLKAMGVGSHGELVDAFGKYGLLGAIPYLGIFIGMIKKERTLQRTGIGFGYIVTFIILFCFNPCFYIQLNFILMFVLPGLTLIYNSDNNEEVEKTTKDRRNILLS